ncbi:MAG TPA: DUF1579 family protein [Thermoanaerobaculia bacterium]|nr:DUF1579 family protein [Thermoanaerobaculia bacterium]
MSGTAASPELAPLESFSGRWDTEGEMRSAAGPSRAFKARDAYEWVAGGQFLLHRFDADMPDGKVEGIEIIGYDRESRSYVMHSFDSTGTATVMRGTNENGRWMFEGERARFRGGFRDGGRVFAGLWEMRSADGSPWEPWMDVTLRKRQ